MTTERVIFLRFMTAEGIIMTVRAGRGDYPTVHKDRGAGGMILLFFIHE